MTHQEIVNFQLVQRKHPDLPVSIIGDGLIKDICIKDNRMTSDNIVIFLTDDQIYQLRDMLEYYMQGKAASYLAKCRSACD